MASTASFESNISSQDLIRLAGFFDHRSLAIVGTEKNAGKTSTLNHLIAGARASNYPRPLALTSIGRDGESQDLVTAGKKPRIYIAEGTLVATSGLALKNSDALLDIRALTGIQDAFGEIIIARALSDGYVELAGPSRAQELRRCEYAIRQEEPDAFFIVDGALSRRSAAGGGLTDAVILALSPGDSLNKADLIAKAKHATSLLSTPEIDLETKLALVRAQVGGEDGQTVDDQSEQDLDVVAVALEEDGTSQTLKALTLLGQQELLLDFVGPQTQVLFLTGALTDGVIKGVLQSQLAENTKLVVEDGSRLFISPETLKHLAYRKIDLLALNALDLRFVSYNPVARQGLTLKNDQVMADLAKACPVPVLNLGPALMY